MERSDVTVSVDALRAAIVKAVEAEFRWDDGAPGSAGDSIAERVLKILKRAEAKPEAVS